MKTIYKEINNDYYTQKSNTVCAIYNPNNIVLLDKTKDNDPITGTPMKDLTFEWTSFYGQAISSEGRFYQLLAPSYDETCPGYNNFKQMKQNSNLVLTKKEDN